MYVRYMHVISLILIVHVHVYTHTLIYCTLPHRGVVMAGSPVTSHVAMTMMSSLYPHSVESVTFAHRYNIVA